MKTETTKRLEQLLANRFNKRNEFYVFECTIGWYGKEIVDCIMYNCQRETYCYEIKQSKQDFYSKNRLTFIENKNYFVMPYKLYKEVEDEIPPEIGVLVAIDRLEPREREEILGFGIKKTSYWKEPIDGLKELYCIKSARKQELKADKEVILSSMLRSMQRDRIYDLERSKT